MAKKLVGLVNCKNVKIFIESISSVNWIEVYALRGDVEMKFNKFMDKFIWVVNAAFLLVASKFKKVTVDNKLYTEDLRNLKELCDNLYCLEKIINSQQLWVSYKNCKR